jgi:hypothetical protein
LGCREAEGEEGGSKGELERERERLLDYSPASYESTTE